MDFSADHLQIMYFMSYQVLVQLKRGATSPSTLTLAQRYAAVWLAGGERVMLSIVHNWLDAND
jgi:hypothetical protein